MLFMPLSLLLAFAALPTALGHWNCSLSHSLLPPVYHFSLPTLYLPLYPSPLSAICYRYSLPMLFPTHSACMILTSLLALSQLLFFATPYLPLFLPSIIANHAVAPTATPGNHDCSLYHFHCFSQVLLSPPQLTTAIALSTTLRQRSTWCLSIWHFTPSGPFSIPLSAASLSAASCQLSSPSATTPSAALIATRYHSCQLLSLLSPPSAP